ncbi:MAG: indole-3-glycerol-phosphate synthase TrpC, partial [Microbacteriaceae bacterium]
MLDELTAGAREDAAVRRDALPLAQLESIALGTRQPLDAYALLAPANHVRVIAEIKRASPSQGTLASIPSAQDLAAEYADAGADAISVLTESRRFGGSLDDLRAVRDAVDVPLLRKDFISTEY